MKKKIHEIHYRYDGKLYNPITVVEEFDHPLMFADLKEEICKHLKLNHDIVNVDISKIDMFNCITNEEE